LISFPYIADDAADGVGESGRASSAEEATDYLGSKVLSHGLWNDEDDENSIGDLGRTVSGKTCRRAKDVAMLGLTR